MPRFDFYLHDLSFKYQKGITPPQLHERIEHLAQDCRLIREVGYEKIYRCSSIYEVPIFEEKTVVDILYQNPEILSRDQRLFLTIIIDHSTDTTLTNDEVIGLLPEHDDDLVNGLLCLHQVDSSLIPKEHLVYSENDWRKFHRHFLGIYPGDPQYFMSECRKCFPDLHFHDRNTQTLGTFKEGHQAFAQNIAKALGSLNDDLRNHLNLGDIPGSLRAFSSASGFETSNEGNVERKQAFTFEFKDGRNNPVNICCEPHIKISKSDQPGDTTFYFYRIYFHFGKPEVAEGRILVGHMGEHL